MSRLGHRVLGFLLCMALALTASAAFAQKKSPSRAGKRQSASSGTACPKSKKVSAKVMDEAVTHFEKGLQLYSEGALEASLVEFERAYELAPTYKILYNEAQIHRGLNQYAEALNKFERYLRCGGEEIASDRRQEVETEIAALKPRVAMVTVAGNISGAQVSVDDVVVGTTPLPAPLVVNPGQRKIGLSKPGYIPATRVVRVVGSDAIQVKLELVSLKQKEEPPTDPGPRNRAIIAWSATGVLTAAAVVMGILAINAKNDLDDAKATANQDPDGNSLKDQDTKVQRYSLIADVLGGAAIVAGGVSIYFTVKAVNAGNKEQPPSDTAFGFSPSVTVGGAF